MWRLTNQQRERGSPLICISQQHQSDNGAAVSPQNEEANHFEIDIMWC